MDLSNYHLIQEFHAKLSGIPVHFFSKPGLPDWDQVTPTTALLSEEVKPRPTENVLILGCGHGALPAALALQENSILLTLVDTSNIALICTHQTLKVNQVENFTIQNGITSLPDHIETFDKVVIQLPKGRRLARRWLVEAFYNLKTGGRLYLAGPNDLGIKPVIRDAQELFGNAILLAYRKGNRVASFRKQHANPNPLDWKAAPGIEPGSWITFPVELDNVHIVIHSLPGVFSEDHLDEGSALLLEHFDISGCRRILDAGCGYGILGIAAALRSAQKSQQTVVDMVDVNLLAVAAAQQTIEANHIQGIRVLASDLLDSVQDQTYDLILSNPPFHTGKEVDYLVTQSLITQAHQMLNPGGKLVLVANQFIRYEKLIRETFKKVTIRAQTNRFHVISGRK